VHPSHCALDVAPKRRTLQTYSHRRICAAAKLVAKTAALLFGNTGSDLTYHSCQISRNSQHVLCIVLPTLKCFSISSEATKLSTRRLGYLLQSCMQATARTEGFGGEKNGLQTHENHERLEQQLTHRSTLSTTINHILTVAKHYSSNNVFTNPHPTSHVRYTDSENTKACTVFHTQFTLTCVSLFGVDQTGRVLLYVLHDVVGTERPHHVGAVTGAVVVVGGRQVEVHINLKNTDQNVSHKHALLQSARAESGNHYGPPQNTKICLRVPHLDR